MRQYRFRSVRHKTGQPFPKASEPFSEKTQHDVAIETLRSIARGRDDNGRPYGGETCRQMARETLVGIGETWGAA